MEVLCMVDKQVIEEIKTNANIGKSWRCDFFTKSGTNYLGLCPFLGEKHLLSTLKDKQFYRILVVVAQVMSLNSSRSTKGYFMGCPILGQRVGIEVEKLNSE